MKGKRELCTIFATFYGSQTTFKMIYNYVYLFNNKVMISIPSHSMSQEGTKNDRQSAKTRTHFHHILNEKKSYGI